MRDSGLLHALLGLQNLTQLIGHPIVGQSWEGFVIETLLASVANAQASFFRTAAGAEIDLIHKFDTGKVWAIEIKRGLNSKPKKGFYHAIEDLKPEKSFLVHGAEDRYPIAENIEAIGVLDLAHELHNAQ